MSPFLSDLESKKAAQVMALLPHKSRANVLLLLDVHLQVEMLTLLPPAVLPATFEQLTPSDR